MDAVTEGMESLIMSSITFKDLQDRWALKDLQKTVQPGVQGSEHLEIRNSQEGSGRGMFTTRNISAGEEILRIPTPQFYFPENDVCDNCLHTNFSKVSKQGFFEGPSEKNKLCVGCKNVAYCSKKCQKEGWKKHHKHECKKLKALGDFHLNKQCLLTLRLIIMEMNGLIREEMWEVLLSLESQDDRQDSRTMPDELKAGIEKIKSISGTELSQSEVRSMFYRMSLNAFSMMTVEGATLGIMLHPFAACINHSCNPSMYYFHDGTGFVLRSSRGVPKDGEVTLSYLQTSLNVSLRRVKLWSNYGFECICSRCKKDIDDLIEDRADNATKFGALPDVSRLQLDLIDNSGVAMIDTRGSLKEKIKQTANIVTGMIKDRYPDLQFPELLEPIPSFHLQIAEFFLAVGNPLEALKHALRTCYFHDRNLFAQPVDFNQSTHWYTLQMTLANSVAYLERSKNDSSTEYRELKKLEEELSIMARVRHRLLIKNAREAWGPKCNLTHALEHFYSLQNNVTFDQMTQLLENDKPEHKEARDRDYKAAEYKILKWAGLINPELSIFLTRS